MLELFESPAADSILEPVAEMSGFKRPSSVGPLLEKNATELLLPCNKAPTVVTFFALPGDDVELTCPSSLPAANKIIMSSKPRKASSARASDPTYSPRVVAP